MEGADHTTYVAKRNLEADESGQPNRHPLAAVLCKEYRDGRYAAGTIVRFTDCSLAALASRQEVT